MYLSNSLAARVSGCAGVRVPECMGARFYCIFLDVHRFILSSCVESVQVFVRTLTGKTVTLDICLTGDVFGAKLEIENKVGLPVAQQRFIIPWEAA